MEKRVIVFILLTFIVFFAFQQFAPKKPVPSVQPVQEEKIQTADKNSNAPASIEPHDNNQAKIEEPTNPADTQASAQKIVVEGDKYQAILDNQGGVISKWELKEYKTEKKNNFNMISEKRGENRNYFGSLVFGDKDLEKTANLDFYQVTVEKGNILQNKIQAPAVIRLTLIKGDVAIEKKYAFDKANYLVNVGFNIKKGGKAQDGRFVIGEDIGSNEEHDSSTTTLEAVYNTGGKVKRESPPKDPQELKKIEGDMRWVGLDMQYFSMIVMPQQPLQYFNIQKIFIQEKTIRGETIDRDLLKVTTPMNGSIDYQVYLGPKNQENLKAVANADLSEVINYGMFSILVYPLLSGLRWIYQYVHNYGYAIIVLTFILSLILFPFRLKQMISMKKMQAVQPKIKAIQEKYKKFKNDAKKRGDMNQEMMALYKEHNVNPMGGCLPIILQMPLLFAFYSLLAYSIELRHAPFIWWLHDLSVKDPYWILPIVMGITSFISQKMTPMAPSTDPVQAKMMMIMPLIFTVMFINLSSGLNLYFLCSNIFQIVFQKISERWIKDGKAVSPAK